MCYSGYSAHEHTTLYGSIASLPLDITIETLVATALITTGLVLGADQLRPISWSVWAGEIEKRGGAENPFRGLEDRVGFWDIRVCSAPSSSVPVYDVNADYGWLFFYWNRLNGKIMRIG